jgi:serine/threonine protein kinase
VNRAHPEKVRMRSADGHGTAVERPRSDRAREGGTVDEYAGRVLADRYRLPRPPADGFELVETRAFDTYSGQEVLVRQVLLPEVVAADAYLEENGPEPLGESAVRALAAARAAAAIPDHPRLVQVFDIFVEDGSLWIASELVSGRPLAALLAEGPLDAYRAAEIASDVLTALRALHADGWTHRNVTSSTVLVCDDGRAMLDGLAAGAAQEALCGYDPLPEQVPAMTGGAAEDDRAGEDGPDDPPAPAWHGPRSALEIERARQNRITVVGAVTERWAPEQAHPVHENWQLSPPVGAPADLWALGSLLFRSVQGHPPFPEESAAELVQLVCAEPPAYAEECGPLRPVVESLLRPDPEERPEAEELGGWLRSLIRSAPEPDLGTQTVQVPTDPAKLPVKRRRGELVRRRRRESAAAGDGSVRHRRHARGKQSRPARPARPVRPARPPRQERTGHIHEDEVVYLRSPDRDGAEPRRLGARLLWVILALLVAVVVFAVLLMPHRDSADGGNGDRTIPAQMPGSDGGAKDEAPSATSKPTSAKPRPKSKPTSKPPAPATTAPAPPDLGTDFVLDEDPAGFTVAVHTGWQRAGRNARSQVRFTGSDLTMTVVPGRDKATGDAQDPLAYQLVEPELAAFRASSWSSASGLQALTVHGHEAAAGEYTWRDAQQRPVYARNLAVQIDGRYHVILISGPDSARAAVQRAFDKALETYAPR